MGMIRIGISGWRYPPWRGTFYPAGLAQGDELSFAAARLGSVEINGTFYGLQHPAVFAAWHDAVPADFVFAVKAPRYVTHMLRLRAARAPVANFLASGLFALGAKLGPLLWQLPARSAYDPERLESFLALLPHDTAAAAALASSHDARLAGRVLLEPGPLRPLRHAIEVRHPSFGVPDFVARLRRHRVALVVSDAPAWPQFTAVTADFVYCRLHGVGELYAGGYDAAGLAAWAARLRTWAETGDVFAYFDNDAKVRAPFDAMALRALLAADR